VATRNDIATLAGGHTDAPEQRAALEELAGDGYQDQVHQPNRSVLDLLETFPACALPFAEFLDLLPPLRPRYYSISSSPLRSPEVCSITAGVLNSPARSGSGTFHGVCSTHLASLPVDGTVFVFVRKPTIAFHPPENPHVPMIMIGAGTGLAPFRGFLQEREAAGATGKNWLFFGGRSLYHDFLYQLEWQQALKRKSLHRVDVAFSRDQAEKIYVQHRIKQAGKDLFAWLSNGAYFYVCGDASAMAPDVNAALLDVVSEHGNMDADDAQSWLADLTADGRYLRDVY